MEDADQLLNIVTGVVLRTDIAKCLVKITTARRAQMSQFIRKRLNSNEISSSSHFQASKYKLTFDLAVKKVADRAADAKMFTIGGDKDLFGRLLSPSSYLPCAP